MSTRRKGIANLLLLLGFIFLVFSVYLFWLRTSPTKIEFEIQETEISKTDYVYSDSSPYKLTISSIGVELPIIKSKIERGEWEVTEEGVSYLSSSPIPGDFGNSILYGHNWPNLLGKLPKVRPGDEIVITMSNSEVRKFIVDKTQIVEPTNTSILAFSNQPQITIYTCTGILDSKRFVVVAKPSQV